MKIMNYCLSALLVFAVAGCDRLEEDMLSAPDDSMLDRYGLDNVKLGDKRSQATEALQTLLANPMKCTPGKAGLGETRKAFATEECEGIAADGEVGALWDEKVTYLKATFVENRLCSLDIQLKTSGDREALYDAHGKKILSLFGKPDEATTTRVSWYRDGDEAVLKDLGNGKINVEIRNKKVMQALHHQG